MERDFQVEFARSVPHLSARVGIPVEYTKIPDAPRGPEMRFSARRGYDCFLVYAGRHIAVELKQVHAASWPFARLDGYQENKLLSAAEAGARAWVVINFRRQIERKGKPSQSVNRTFGVQIMELLRIRAETGSASISLLSLELRTDGVFVVELQRNTGCWWDLFPLVR